MTMGMEGTDGIGGSVSLGTAGTKAAGMGGRLAARQRSAQQAPLERSPRERKAPRALVAGSARAPPASAVR